MALTLPTTPIVTRVGDNSSFAAASAAVEQAVTLEERDRRDAVYIRRAKEKEGRAYLMVRGIDFRVILDHFILASYQKSVEEVVMPNYTRGQTTLEIFGQRLKQVTLEIDLIESSTELRFDDGGVTGYVGQGVREFVRQYNEYFRGSRLVKKDAIAILSVKGKRDFGYVTSLAFQRMSSNDYHVRAQIGFWVPADAEDNAIGYKLATQLIDRAGAAFLPGTSSSNAEAPTTISLEELPSREAFAARFFPDEEELNRVTILVRDKDDQLILKYDNMYVTQVVDVDTEKVQFEISSHTLTKAWFYGRHLKALSVSAVLFDLEQQETAEYPQAQMELFEYLYDHYLRAPQVGHHRYKIQMFVRGHMYEGMLANYSLGLAADDGNIGAVSFTFFVVEEDTMLNVLPTVMNGDVNFGPPTFTKETVDELRSQGEIAIREELPIRL